MYLQIEPHQVPAHLHELSVLAASAAALLSGLVPDELMSVEGEHDEPAARMVSDVFDYVYEQDGTVRNEHQVVADFLRLAADRLASSSAGSGSESS